MMEAAGRCIFVNGPAFAGKTTLIMRLLKDLPDLSVVNYELFFSRTKQFVQSNLDFYRHIHAKVERGDKVICECVQNNILTETLCDVKFDVPVLCIVVLPPVDDHCDHQRAYRANYGLTKAFARDGGANARDLREVFLNTYKLDHIVYDGSNYVEILEAVKEYANLYT